MTQEEFNAMMDNYLAQYLDGGYYTSQYSGEEIDTAISKVASLEGRVTALEDRAAT